MSNFFYFDPEHLGRLAGSLASVYKTAEPFPHIAIDNFLPLDTTQAILDEFPTPKAIEWLTYDYSKELKLACEDETKIPPFTRHVLSQFNSSTFITFLEQLTGIEGLVPDPHFRGGGMHQIKRGGFLKVHSDFNFYKRLRLDRRLNILLYLNKDWQEDYGGHLQLWNKEMTECKKKILPIFNRCVVFSTTDFTNHGHPDPLTCPEGWTRKSLALYYYSNGRPQEEVSQAHSTLFRERPGEAWRASKMSFKSLAKRCIPPILLDGAKTIRQRLSRYPFLKNLL